MGDDSIDINKDIAYAAIIAVLLVLNIASVFTQGFGLMKPPEPFPPQPNSSMEEVRPVPAEGKMAELMDGGLKLGSDASPVVIVEFSDLQCPFCRSFWGESLPSLKNDYINTGQVQLVYRNYPLSFHPTAEKASEAIECAADQGKGWEYMDKGFEEQAKLGSGTVPFTVQDLKSWADAIGLDNTAFDNCLDSGKYSAMVQNDLKDGADNGVQGTPTFILGKRDGSDMVPIDGAQPYGTFKATIDQLLK